MNTYRCFVAIDLPEQVKDTLAQVRHKSDCWPARIKWVERDNFHLTLKFLGDVTDNQIELLKAALTQTSLDHKKFEISIGGLGAFPSIKAPKVLWAGIRDSQHGLQQIWSGIENKFANLGFPKETKRFSPHLTLGRLKEESAGDLTDVLLDIKLGDILIPVREVKLMSSQLTRQGPVYTALGSFGLQ